MSLSSRFAVAVHVLTLLAQVEDRPATSEYMAGSINTDPVVVRRILGALRKAGLVTTQPGVGGGSSLARDPEQITLLDVYRAVEKGRLFSLHHRPPNPHCVVGGNIQTTLESVFGEAEAAMEEVLAGITVTQVLQDVVACAGQVVEQ